MVELTIPLYAVSLLPVVTFSSGDKVLSDGFAHKSCCALSSAFSLAFSLGSAEFIILFP
jgi:hypothetical protein